MKQIAHHFFTLVLALASLVPLATFPAVAGARQDQAVAHSGKASTLADLPPDARKAISNALKREGVLAPQTFMEKGKLTSSDGLDNGTFGGSVAISGDTVVVGASVYAAPWAAYVFVKPPGGWTSGVQSAKLTASDGAAIQEFSYSVAISGDTVVVGAPGPNQKGVGTVYVFVKPASGWAGTLTENAKLTASDGASGGEFGLSVAISGDNVVAGANKTNTHAEFCYVFVKPTGGWAGSLMENAKLTTSDGKSPDNGFGFSVGIEGGTVVAGAIYDGDNFGTNFQQGATFVFGRPRGGWAGLLSENAKLTASDFSEYDRLGYSVAIAGDTIVAGEIGSDSPHPGSGYVFVKPPGGWFGSLNENARLTASDGANVGFSMAISGDNVVTGIYQIYNVPGSAYVFTKPSGGWSGVVSDSAKLAASDGENGDFFGVAVAISGNTVVVGTATNDLGTEDKGAAYVFETDSPAVSYVINYSYRFASGARQRGTNTLFADGTFQDSSGSGGTWALTQSGRLTLRYQGTPCDAFLSGHFKSPTKLSGTIRCTDGSGDTGTWQGTILPQ